jgi:outer membrane lipoprotein-sorting protein
MNAMFLVALSLVNVAIAQGQHPSPPAKLEALRGTLIMMISENEGVSCEIWAAGNSSRSELIKGGIKVTTIQRGDTMYTFDDTSLKGKKERIKGGLAAKGLVKQIEEVRKNGKKVESREIEGQIYDVYQYSVDSDEIVVAVLSARTYLPRAWVSSLRIGLNRASTVSLIYRDMEANVNIPDDLFKLPANVKFSEER